MELVVSTMEFAKEWSIPLHILNSPSKTFLLEFFYTYASLVWKPYFKSLTSESSLIGMSYLEHLNHQLGLKGKGIYEIVRWVVPLVSWHPFTKTCSAAVHTLF